VLFHVTMTHTPEDCPGYDKEIGVDWVARSEKLDQIAGRLNVEVLFFVVSAPEHIGYALLEAESLSSLFGYLNAIPIRQDFQISPVMHNAELVAMAKAMMKQK